MNSLPVSTPWLIILATVASTGLLFLIASKLGTNGKSQLTGFLLVAGGGSAWLSPRYPQWAWPIFLAALAVAFLVWLLFHKLGMNIRPTTITWSQYLRGQGALLFFFLVVGGAFAWLSVTYGPFPGRVSKNGQLIKFENLDPSQHPVNEEVDVENYNQITVFTKSGTPANGSASLTIYLDHGRAEKLEVGHLDSEAATWSRWDQANAGKQMSLVVNAPTQAGTTPATQVEILVYLAK